MIVILKQNAQKGAVEKLVAALVAAGVQVQFMEGQSTTIMGLIGDTSILDLDTISSYECVESVKRVREPFKNANRKFHPTDTVVEVGKNKIGAGTFNVIAGPCSVENEEQIVAIAKAVKKAGATLLRGGAYKPRTSPYSFQGLGAPGLELLKIARQETGLPIVTEIMSVAHLVLFQDVDVIQVGARNMQNFELLKELGRLDKPILLKRGLANTYEELLMSAEYIMSEGNKNVILCERGIRTFENQTRNTLDISAIPVLKRLSHLPVVIDPSHAGGVSWLVEPLSKAAVSAGADGLIIEVHNNPKEALSDGAQCLDFEEFGNLMPKLTNLAKIEGREV